MINCSRLLLPVLCNFSGRFRWFTIMTQPALRTVHHRCYTQMKDKPWETAQQLQIVKAACFFEPPRVSVIDERTLKCLSICFCLDLSDLMSTMSQDRLTGLALMYIHQDITVSPKKVISNRRIDFVIEVLPLFYYYIFFNIWFILILLIFFPSVMY